jgi:5-formyltetrahydrofolate cyclo-ligase
MQPTEDIILIKKSIRKEISALKKEIPFEKKIERSAPILDKLESHPDFIKAQNILFYWSMNDEVHTHIAVQRLAAHKNIFLPVVDGDDLLIKKFNGVETLVAGESFAIPEPSVDAEETSIENIDLVVVPGVAFDRQGGRMGRGKGFYDRMFSKVTKKEQTPVKIGVCFNFQLIDSVPKEPHDELMNTIITESEIIEIG